MEYPQMEAGDTMAFDITKIQDGNRICGLASVNTGEDVMLTKEIAGRVGGSFVYWLSQNVQKNPTMLKICVGCDPRLSGEVLKEGVLEAISLWGAEGCDVGYATSDAMHMAVTAPQYEFDGAVLVTGGELPGDMNGFRFFTAEDEPDSEDIAEILRLAAKYNFIGGTYDENKDNLMAVYAAMLRQKLSMGLRNVPGLFGTMHFIIDAGNGTGGFFATDVLEKLGADISGSCNLEPDGHFPAHSPDPEDETAVEEMKKLVKEEGADLGLILSADAGRLAAITSDDIIFADGGKAVNIVVDAVIRKADK